MHSKRFLTERQTVCIEIEHVVEILLLFIGFFFVFPGIYYFLHFFPGSFFLGYNCCMSGRFS